MTSTRDLLIAARARIANPLHWMQHADAEDLEVRGVTATDIAGAVRGLSESAGERVRVRMALRRSTGAWSLTRWNDEPGRTHAEVLAAFDRAIEAQK